MVVALPTYDDTALPTAPAVVPPNAGPPIAPAITPPAFAVPACIRRRAAYRAGRTRFVLSSRQLQSCPSRLHSPPGCLSRLPIAPFNCSIPDCEDSSIRVIKRYAAGFSFATIAHRRERLALPNLHLHSPAAQLLQLLGQLYQHQTCLSGTCTESTAFTNRAALFSARSCSCITACTTCLLTDGQLIETVLNAADARLHFAVKECVAVAIALSTWQMT